MGAGAGVVLPGMAARGRDDYGGGRSLGSNGQAIEPLSKRPRWVGWLVGFVLPWLRAKVGSIVLVIAADCCVCDLVGCPFVFVALVPVLLEHEAVVHPCPVTAYGGCMADGFRDVLVRMQPSPRQILVVFLTNTHIVAVSVSVAWSVCL